jgi:hypothetical protein
MERGHNRALPVADKAARGTFQPCRDAGKVQIIVPGDPPQMPDFLTAEAEIVWQETVGRVMYAGVAEPDSSFLGRYCAMEALSRKALGQGEPIPAALMTALRQMEELLGIAGPKSRIGRVTDGKPSNPFARNGRR